MLVSFQGHSHLQDLQHANAEGKAWKIMVTFNVSRQTDGRYSVGDQVHSQAAWIQFTMPVDRLTPSVYLMSSHVTRPPRPSPSIFAHCKYGGEGGGNGLRTRLTQHCRYGCMHCIYKPRDSWIGSAKGTNALQRGETTPANPDAAVTTPRTVPYMYMHHIGYTDTTMYERYMHKKEG